MADSLPDHCSCAVATTAVCAVHGLLGRRVIDPPIPLSIAAKAEAVTTGALQAKIDSQARAIATLEAIVSAFCKAVGDPIPQDGICTAARLRAENEALKHIQQWRAVGIDKGEGGEHRDHAGWRDSLGQAEEDAAEARAEMPTFDEVFIEVRWLSKPERSVGIDEQHVSGVSAATMIKSRSWDPKDAGRRAVGKHGDALARLSDEQEARDA